MRLLPCWSCGRLRALPDDLPHRFLQIYQYPACTPPCGAVGGRYLLLGYGRLSWRLRP